MPSTSTASIKIWTSRGMDGTAVFTFGPNDTTLPVEQPYFLVAPRAVEPPQPSERDNFARRALATFINRPELRIVASEQIRRLTGRTDTQARKVFVGRLQLFRQQ